MRSRVASLAALAVGLLISGACSSDSSPTVVPSQSSSTAPSTTAPTTTAAPTTTTTTVPIMPAASPTDAADEFVAAWHNGDPAAASSIATAAAVQAVFGAGQPGRTEDRGCNTPPPDSPVLCVYRTGAGELQVRLQQRADGWFVDQAILTPA